jgi:hypothetical protein
MTTAPSRPLVHYYDPGKDPMEIVDTASGRMERWRADALLVGETSGLTELSKQVRAEAVETINDIEAREQALTAREDAIVERERAHAVSVARFTNFVGKAALLFDRLEKAKADAIAGKDEPLATPPGPDYQSKLPEPSLEVEGDAIPGTPLSSTPPEDQNALLMNDRED